MLKREGNEEVLFSALTDILVIFEILLEIVSATIVDVVNNLTD